MFTVPTGVEAICFDIWKTLLSGNKAFTRPRLQLIFNLLGHHDVDVEALRTAYLTADKYFNNLAEEHCRDYGLRDRIEMMYVALGISDETPDDDMIEQIQSEVARLRMHPDYMPAFIEPDLPATLTALRGQGYSLGLLSNTGMDNEVVMEAVLRQLGIWDYFDVRVFTSEDGRAKPNPDLFLDTAQLLSTKPDGTLHVGDNVIADYLAIEAGLHAVVFAPDGIEGYPSIQSMKELLVREV